MKTNADNPDLDKVPKISEETDLQVDQDFMQYLLEARDYLLFYNWCSRISEEYIGAFFNGIVGVFLFRIEPKLIGVDDWVWVIVGDLPPAYLTCEIAPNAEKALEAYIGAMAEWVEAADIGASVADLIPVDVPATLENAEKLRKRLRFLQQHILPEIRKGGP